MNDERVVPRHKYVEYSSTSCRYVLFEVRGGRSFLFLFLVLVVEAQRYDDRWGGVKEGTAPGLLTWSPALS